MVCVNTAPLSGRILLITFSSACFQLRQYVYQFFCLQISKTDERFHLVSEKTLVVCCCV